MLHVCTDSDNADTSVPVPGFIASGLPDDFHAFMSDVLVGEPRISDVDVDAMWAEEQALRNAERELLDAAAAGVALTRELADVLAGLFPSLRAESAPAA